MIQVYFLNSRDKNINDKLDLNGYAIIAKHLVVLASIGNIKDCMMTFWSHMSELLVQTVVDCDSTVTHAPLDMDVFCQKAGNLLTAISHEIKQSNSKDKYAALQTYTNVLSKRLLKASLESSIVHKDKSFSLLVLAHQLLCGYQDAVIETEGLVYATKQLLVLLSEGPENIGVSLAPFYVNVVSTIKDHSDAKDLWSNLMDRLHDMINTEGLELQGSKALLLVLDQIQSEKLIFNFDPQNEKLDSIIKDFALVKLNEPAITIPRPILESIVSSGLKFYLGTYSKIKG